MNTPQIWSWLHVLKHLSKTAHTDTMTGLLVVHYITKSTELPLLRKKKSCWSLMQRERNGRHWAYMTSGIPVFSRGHRKLWCDSNQMKCDRYTWLCSQFLGSSLALRFLKLRRALDGLEKPRSDSWLLLPSLELLLEVEMEQDSTVWAVRGDTELAMGGWQLHR